MKKTLSIAAFFLGTLAAHAETVRVNIPFAFSAGGTAMPAGSYSIREVPGSTPVLLITGSGSQALVFGRIVPMATDAAKTQAISFQKEALTGIVLAGRAFELNSPGSQSLTDKLVTLKR